MKHFKKNIRLYYVDACITHEKCRGDDTVERKWNNWKDVLKRGLYSVSFLIVSMLYTVINQYTGREKELTTFVDNLIPFNKYFILAYVFWYVYIGVFLVYFCLFDEKKYYKILIGLNAGMIISYFVYIIFPTTVPRPVFAAGDGIIGSLFNWLYARDNPYNCFPSIHVMNTLIIAVYVQKDKFYLNKYIKAVSAFCACAIIYSTLAIKQHVVLDVLLAAIVAYTLYGILDYREIFAKVRDRLRIQET